MKLSRCALFEWHKDCIKCPIKNKEATLKLVNLFDVSSHKFTLPSIINPFLNCRFFNWPYCITENAEPRSSHLVRYIQGRCKSEGLPGSGGGFSWDSCREPSGFVIIVWKIESVILTRSETNIYINILEKVDAICIIYHILKCLFYQSGTIYNRQ